MSRRKPVEFSSNGIAVGYIRVSTQLQADSKLGLQAQSDNVLRKAYDLGLKFASHNMDATGLDRPGFYCDEAVSAFRMKMTIRPAGRKMLDLLEVGDTLIVSRLDRAFRSVGDFIMVTDLLERKGVRLVVCHPQIDMGTAIGRAQAQIMAVLAEWESARKGERIRAALAVKRNAENRSTTPREPKTTNEPSEWRPVACCESCETDKPTGRVFISMRCSHRDSVSSGLGLAHQLLVAKTFADKLIENNKTLAWGGDFTDLAVSAASWELVKRPSGSKLNAELRSGDHVVFSSLDRGFRSVSDLAQTQKDWDARGITMHFVDEGISTDNAFGRMVASLSCCFAEMEADLVADRSREARVQLATVGKFVGGAPPPFWEVFTWTEKGGEKKKKLILSRKKIVAFRLVKFLRHFRDMTITDAITRCEELVSAKEGRPAIPQHGAEKGSPVSGWLSRNLPKWPRDKAGIAWPPMTKRVYARCREVYEEAIIKWREQVLNVKRVLQEARK